jgi:hypothetical protein
MVKALRAWTTTGKVIPLAWNHSSDPEDIVGHIDPETVRQEGDGVVAEGQVDLDTGRGQQVWRLMKSGTLGSRSAIWPSTRTGAPTASGRFANSTCSRSAPRAPR